MSQSGGASGTPATTTPFASGPTWIIDGSPIEKVKTTQPSSSAPSPTHLAFGGQISLRKLVDVTGQCNQPSWTCASATAFAQKSTGPTSNTTAPNSHGFAWA